MASRPLPDPSPSIARWRLCEPDLTDRRVGGDRHELRPHLRRLLEEGASLERLGSVLALAGNTPETRVRIARVIRDFNRQLETSLDPGVAARATAASWLTQRDLSGATTLTYMRVLTTATERQAHAYRLRSDPLWRLAVRAVRRQVGAVSATRPLLPAETLIAKYELIESVPHRQLLGICASSGCRFATALGSRRGTVFVEETGLLALELRGDKKKDLSFRRYNLVLPAFAEALRPLAITERERWSQPRFDQRPRLFPRDAVRARWPLRKTNISIADVRPCVVNLLLQAGTTREETARQLGHSEATSRAFYARMAESDRRAASDLQRGYMGGASSDGSTSAASVSTSSSSENESA